MLENMLVQLFEISVTTSIIILGLRLLAPYLNKTYTAKWKYWIWLVLAIRLVIPINISFPTAPLRVNIPTASSSDAVTVQPNAVIVPPEPILPLTETAQRTFTLLDAFTMIWVIGIVAFMVCQLTGYFIFKKKVLRWSKVPQDPRVESAIHSASSQIGLTRKVIPLISDNVSSPLMIGFFRPLLILPGDTYSDADLSLIIRHELVHCKRNDLWYKLLLIVANAVHWFNPVIYLMFHEAGGDLELSCDDAVTNEMSFAERKAYTETILASIQRQRMGKTDLSTYFYGGQRTMKNRFINILNTGKKRRGVIAFLAVLLCTVLTGGLIACTADTENNSADGSDNNYINSEYEFTFDIPSDWKDKYKVIEANETISFVYSDYELEDKNYQEFFRIVVMSRDDYEKLLDGRPMTGVLLAEKSELTYILYTPLDMAIMDSKKAEEYSELFLSIDQIKERFNLVSDK